MRRIWLAAAVVCALLSTGCPVTKFDIRMKPLDDGLQRELTVWKEGQENKDRTADSGVLEMLTKLYGEPTKDADGTATFRARFDGKTPDDVGGAGRYVRYASDLGTATAYVERFGEKDDVAGRLEAQLKVIDRQIDVAMGWLAQELGKDPKFVTGRDKLDKSLRTDAKNLLLMARTAAVLDEFEADGGAKNPAGGLVRESARALLYLAERDYFQPVELPRIIEIAREKDGDAMCRLLQRLLARKLGYAEGQALPESFAFLNDAEAAGASFQRHIETTPEYRTRPEHEQSAGHEQPDSRPTPGGFPEGLTIDLDLPWLGFDNPGRLVRVALACASEPWQTNGWWDAKAGEVRWDWRKPEGILPRVCFAVWAEPDNAAQNARFGKVALTGDKLLQYAIWRNGITAEQGRQWDQFSSSLKPGPELADKIGGFSFSPSTATRQGEDRSDPAEIARSLLLDALKEKKP